MEIQPSFAASDAAGKRIFAKRPSRTGTQSLSDSRIHGAPRRQLFQEAAEGAEPGIEAILL
jgi:hypothetical protein